MADSLFPALPTSALDRHGRAKHLHECEACYGLGARSQINCAACDGEGYVSGTIYDCRRDDCSVVADEAARHDAEESRGES